MRSFRGFRSIWGSRGSLGLAVALALTLTGTVLTAPAAAKPPSASEQLQFGVDMAKRGLWGEALFRFKQAHRLDPSNARILNNLAVAYEAVGRFDDALEHYKLALAANPGNRELKRNYASFIEFYQGFRPEGAAQEAGDSADETADEQP